MTPLTPAAALKRPCPECGAEPGTVCRDAAAGVHLARQEATEPTAGQGREGA